MLSHCHALRNSGALIIWIALGSASAQELTLDETRRLAETAQPMLAARYSAIDAAREAAVAARALPDPKLRLGFVNVPIEGADALSLGAEAMTMTTVGVMQEFPRQAKRELKSEMLRLSGERSGQELAFLRLQIRRDAALAWLDAWSAARAIDLVDAQRSEAQVEIDALTIALRNNRASAAALSEARVALELLGDRRRMLEGEQQAARAALARWIGDRAGGALPQTLPPFTPPVGAESLVRHIEAHPHLASVDTQARIAATDAQLANLSVRPDWSMELAYGKRGSGFADMVSLQFQIELPILQHQRQDRTIAAKLAEAQQAREMREDNLREMRADALQLHARRETADERARLFSERVLPLARERLQAALAGYRSGKGALSEVLAARRALLELELETLMRRVEAAKAAVALDFFVGASGGRP
jgi:outer membrane protein TolC